MFNLLKKKIISFTQKITEKISSARQNAVKKQAVIEPVKEKPLEEPIEETVVEEPEIEVPVEVKGKPIEALEIKKPVEKKIQEKIPEKEIKPKHLEEKKAGIKLGIATKIKSFLTQAIEIKENEIADFLLEFELSLMEADVDQEIAEQLTKKIKERIVGKKIPKGTDLTEWVKVAIKEVLREAIDVKGIDLNELIKTKEKPFIIMFLGPNGAGKTTSIAKLAFLLKETFGFESILAASDTFRAAAIEQLEKHAQKLGLRIVKHKYGSDPAAVAFDAVKAAKASNLQVVLIDTAGRQETNINLMNELKKIEKVNKPHLKIFVGEALAGKALLQQALEYNEKIGLDGFILTKIDADVKGGTAISLLAKVKKPILFVGTGQAYKDFIPFTKEFLVDRVV